ncbi:SusC/RagA family TonB-linked outer membrane protein [Pedobacter punctiformis]|uniref:SusC/RagA family TonB-linked outer membrane protein n=1 Tax=Pedobacter punctiformis TaxID=3004097 RepID=A0ABT4L713_9SPHI|nr:SusC/RagA family TonB-linked outer membrane protein [Pedobacter sp. HCMS5-2]MCZ4242594.1 SusC/RagA family TonB-linked outer membrane protein [Pedobacter sp. HCMS5-2]
MKIKSLLLLGGIVLLWLSKSQAVAIEVLSKTIITANPAVLKQPLTVSANHFADITVKGKITDASGPLPGASISLKSNPAIGTSSDGNGNFVITVPADGILVIKSIGYKTIEVPVQNQTTLNIKLEEENNTLSDVVVVGYSSKKQGELSSSVSVISAEKLKGVASNDVISMIQGKAPGVVVSSGSGDPTAAPKINIRGISSINGGTAPLLVVDGNILGAYGSEGATYSPNDVETITILKDAAATGLYGSRAGSGVIIVTTKTGKAGESKIEFNSVVGFNSPSTGKFKLMNSQQLYDYQKTFSNPSPSVLNNDTNWWDLATRDGMTQNYTISASGGTEKTRYYVAGNFYREQGTVINNDKNAYNLRANLSSQLTKKLKLSLLLNGVFTRDNYANSNTLGDGYLNLPFDPAYNADGTPVDPRIMPTWLGRDVENFIHSTQYNLSYARSLNLSADVNLDYNIVKNLTFSSYNRTTFYNTFSVDYYDKRTKEGGATNGALYNSTTYKNRLLSSNRLKYENSFGEHHFTVLAVGEAEKSYYDEANLNGKNLPAGRPVMSTATDIIGNPSGGTNEYNFSKYLSQVDYNYAGKYFAVASFVHENSSRFGINKSGGDFYQMGASWILSNEQFLKSVKPISFLKLRASYGTTGNAEIGDYPSLGLYSIDTGSSYGGLPGASPSQRGNPNLTWEKQKTANIGLDIGFWNRIDLSVDLYDKRSNALLFFVPLPSTEGYKGYFDNVGSLKNRGLEFNLTTKNFTGEFKWETNLNMAFNRNTIISLTNGKDAIDGTRSQPSAIGRDIFDWKMPIWAGVDPNNGDPLWEKVITDADGVQHIAVTNSYAQASRQYTGTSTSPKFTGGFTNTFSYKGISLSAFFNFVYGNEVYNNSRAYFDNDGLYESYNAMVLKSGWNRWEKIGDVATHPKPVLGGNHDSNQQSTRYLEDGSYIRLRNITLGYQIPNSWLSKIKISSARVFVSGDNLWTGTKFSGIDPEVDLSSGVSSFRYPLSKKVLFGVNIGL